MRRLRAFFIPVVLVLAACRAGSAGVPALPNAVAARAVRSNASVEVWTMSDAVRVRAIVDCFGLCAAQCLAPL